MPPSIRLIRSIVRLVSHSGTTEGQLPGKGDLHYGQNVFYGWLHRSSRLELGVHTSERETTSLHDTSPPAYWRGELINTRSTFVANLERISPAGRRPDR